MTAADLKKIKITNLKIKIIILESKQKNTPKLEYEEEIKELNKEINFLERLSDKEFFRFNLEYGSGKIPVF